MLDYVIRGATIVDGTGAPGFSGEIGIRDGRVVAVGKVDEDARETIDATGKVVAPGFVDSHTHYDAQVFWDPSLSPSCYHGVTTVVAGNCGYSIAPTRPSDRASLVRTLDKDPTHIHKDSRRFWLDWAGRHFEGREWWGIFRFLFPGGYYLHWPTRAWRGIAPAIAVVARAQPACGGQR